MLVLTVNTPRKQKTPHVNPPQITLRFPDGEEGVITFFSCSHSGRVRVGIEMPPDVQILRGSLLAKLAELNVDTVAG